MLVLIIDIAGSFIHAIVVDKACMYVANPVLQLGQLVPDPRWYNAGYIFPAGFKSRLLFRSSVDLDALTLHECEIVGEGGKYWPAPTFVVTARDREDEPMVAKSCTGCWSGVSRCTAGT